MRLVASTTVADQAACKHKLQYCRALEGHICKSVLCCFLPTVNWHDRMQVHLAGTAVSADVMTHLLVCRMLQACSCYRGCCSEMGCFQGRSVDTSAG